MRDPEHAHELLERYYNAFNAQDVRAMLALLSDDVIHDINHNGREIGKEAFAAFMEKMNRCYKEQVVELHTLSDYSGERAAAEFVVLGEYEQTDQGLPEARGQQYRLPAGAFFEIHEGKITRVSNYYNLNDWLAQIK